MDITSYLQTKNVENDRDQLIHYNYDINKKKKNGKIMFNINKKTVNFATLN